MKKKHLIVVNILASVAFLAVSIMKYLDKDTKSAAMWLICGLIWVFITVKNYKKLKE